MDSTTNFPRRLNNLTPVELQKYFAFQFQDANEKRPFVDALMGELHQANSVKQFMPAAHGVNKFKRTDSDRQESTILSSSDLTITNFEYSSSFYVPWFDWRLDATGTVAASVQLLASEANALVNDLVVDTLHDMATVGKDLYDGQPFFSASHGGQSNLLTAKVTSTADVTMDEAKKALSDAFLTLTTLTDSRGNYVNANVSKVHVCVGTKYATVIGNALNNMGADINIANKDDITFKGIYTMSNSSVIEIIGAHVPELNGVNLNDGFIMTAMGTTKRPIIGTLLAGPTIDVYGGTDDRIGRQFRQEISSFNDCVKVTGSVYCGAGSTRWQRGVRTVFST